MQDKPILYGDGIHDNTATLQHLTDTSNHELTLPESEIENDGVIEEKLL